MKRNAREIVLTGSDLSINDIAVILKDETRKVSFSNDAISKVKKCKQFLDENIKGRIVYGINTGFGPMATRAIGDSQLEELQRNLIRSHATGIGAPIKSEYVLSAMVIRLNMLLKGYSGASPELISRLRDFINNRIVPVVPEHGAVGTSGDLVQLAHIALALIGEGEVFYKGERKNTKDVLRRLGIKSYALKPKEGLALINGTSIMTGVLAVNILHAEKLLRFEIRSGALALEHVKAFDDSVSPVLHGLRPHAGQKFISGAIRDIVKDSKLLRKREHVYTNCEVKEDVCEMTECVQEVYSFRCISQILGPVYEAIEKVKKTVEIEMNSVTDNPIIDWKGKKFLHGGNFHGDVISYSADELKIAMVKLTMLSERRTNFFLHERINRIFPPFLNMNKPGLTLALQGLQFVATSTTAGSQTLAFPQYVHSIPTNADNQDVVSMGTDSALFCAKVLENAYAVLGIELLVLSQAVDILKNGKMLSSSSRELYSLVRKNIPVVFEDRVINLEMERLLQEIKSLT